MRRATGAAALGYVVLAAIENMGLLVAPGLGASHAGVRAAYADTALVVVTTAAGALSLACYVAFAALLAPRRLLVALAGALLAGAGVVLVALLVAGGDPALYDASLTLRYLAGPLMAVFLVGAAGAMPRPLRLAAPAVALPLALTPLALASFELGAQLAFAAHAGWIWAAGLWLAVGGAGFVRRAAFLMLVVAAGLVGIALLAVPSASGAFFAWGLEPAAVAAFAGGVYVGSALVYAAGLRASRRHAQPLVVAAVVLSVLVLAATFVHLEVFDFDRLQAWAWVALFAAFGATTTALAVTGPWRRAPGAELPALARGLLAAVAAALLVAAVALWIDPGAYDLPPLGGRFAGSWAAMLATLAAWPAVRGRRDEARLPVLALVALPTGALVAALRTLGEPDPRYLAALLVLLAASATLGRLGGSCPGNTGSSPYLDRKQDEHFSEEGRAVPRRGGGDRAGARARVAVADRHDAPWRVSHGARAAPG
jgi:hypothetical protein